MADNFQRTVYGAYLQTCMLEALPFTMEANTTLNEKFGIESGVAPNAGVMPAQQYFAIGNGGHKFQNTSANIPKPVDVIHSATDAALFSHLPFVLRELSNDLTATERARFALRTVVTYNGVKYVAYYLRRLDLSGVVPQMLYKTVAADGTVTFSSFTPDSSNLNPTPGALSSNGVNIATGNYVAATAKTPVTFDSWDIAELQNVANIIWADTDLAIISEIALCSGVDKQITTNTAGQASFNFMEAIAVQCCTFFNVFWAAKYSNSNLSTVIDIGCSEPIGTVTSATA